MIVFLGGFPPGGNRGLVLGGGGGGRRRGKGSNEIRNDSTLGRLEFSIPDEVYGDLSREERAVMVFQEQRLLLYQLIELSSSVTDMEESDHEYK